MTQYNETMLNTLEEGKDIRKAVRNNGRYFLTLSEADRSYRAVADKFNITEGRAGVYVREYLGLIGKDDEKPRRGSSNGASKPTATGNILLDNTLAQREQMLAEQDRKATEINDANEAVAHFDADVFKAEVASELEDQIKDLTARLKAWTEDTDKVATKSATDTLADLTKRAETTSAESGDILANLTKQLSLVDATLKMIVTMDEDARKDMLTAHKDLMREIAPELVPEETPAEGSPAE